MSEQNDIGSSEWADALIWKYLIATVFLLAAGAVSLVINTRDTQEDYDEILPNAQSAWNAEVRGIRWRNAFWNEIAHPDDGAPDAVKPELPNIVRKIFLDKEKMSADEWRSFNNELSREGTDAQNYGVLTRTGELSPYALGRIKQISAGPNNWRPEALPDPIDEKDPKFHQSILRNLLAWPMWMLWWQVLSVLGHIVITVLSVITDNRPALLLHIPEARGAPVARAVLAILYAPVLLPLAIGSLVITMIRLVIDELMNLPGYLTRAKRKVSEWNADMRNPYRAQIRKARKALEDLRAMSNPDPELVGAAEQMLALWSGRHAEETAKNATEQEKAAREARLLKIRTSLLELTTETEVDGIESRRDRSVAASRTSSGS